MSKVDAHERAGGSIAIVGGDASGELVA